MTSLLHAPGMVTAVQILRTCCVQTWSGVEDQQLAAQCSPLVWDDVYSLAVLHGVAPLVHANLQRCTALIGAIPAEVTRKLRTCWVQNVGLKDRAARTIDAVADLCTERGLDLMLVKGAALDAVIYREPWFTISGDVDVVVGRSASQADSIIRSDLQALSRGATHVELGYGQHHDVTMNNVLPVDFGKIWEDSRRIRLRNREVFVMSVEDMLICACIQVCRKRFSLYKPLLDVAEIVRCSPALDWARVIQRSRSFECETIVYAALKCVEANLDCKIPDWVLPGLRRNGFRASVIDHLVKWGPVGRGRLSHTFRKVRGMRVPRLNSNLILPYSTYRWSQLWRHLMCWCNQIVEIFRRKRRRNA